MLLSRIVYVSEASDKESLNSVEEQIEKIRSRNAAKKITGMLLCIEEEQGNYFVQLLEGDELDLMLLMTRIKKDDRHDKIQLIHSKAVLNRDFEDWSMGVARISSDSPADFQFKNSLDLSNPAVNLDQALTIMKKIYELEFQRFS